MSPNSKLSRLGVLALSSTEVEWLDHDADGRPRYACGAVQGSTAADYLRAALEVRQAAGGTARNVVLALRDGLVHQRLVELPELGKRELKKVLERKAALACGEPAEPPFFSATQQTAPKDGKPGRWLLSSMESRLARELALGLRRRGLRTRRVTSVALSALDRAALFREEDSDGALCVLVGRRTIQVSLFCRDELVTVETLDGNLLETPQLVASLLQSIKTTAGYWRKTRRGTPLQDVTVVGLHPDRGRLMSNAISIALPGSRVHCWPAPRQEGEPKAELHPQLGRIALLEGTLLDGAFSPRLTFPLPERRTVLAASAAALIAVAGWLFMTLSDQVDTRVRTLEQDIERSHEVSREIGRLERARERARSQTQVVAEVLARTDAVVASGLDFEGLCVDLAAALGDDTSLLGVSVGRELGTGRELALQAVAHGDSVSALEAIGRLQRTLESLPRFSDVWVDLPVRVGDGAEVEFSLRARLGGRS